MHSRMRRKREPFCSSQAVQVGQTLYLSGCLGLDPKTGQFVGEGVQEQARQVSSLVEIDLF